GRVGGDAVAGPQGQHGRLVAAGGAVEDLVAGFGRGALVDEGDVAVGGADVPPPPADRRVAVGGAADAEVLPLGPVEEVVTALAPRSGPVGDLVPGAAGGAEGGVGRPVPGRLVVVVGGGDLTGGDPPGQRRAGLDGEGVGADVGRIEGQGGVERGLPVGRR